MNLDTLLINIDNKLIIKKENNPRLAKILYKIWVRDLGLNIKLFYMILLSIYIYIYIFLHLFHKKINIFSCIKY